jgi:hypothetical protein
MEGWLLVDYYGQAVATTCWTGLNLCEVALGSPGDPAPSAVPQGASMRELCAGKEVDDLGGVRWTRR